VLENSRLSLVDVLTLQYKGQGFFTALMFLVVCAGLRVCSEWNVVVIAVKFIWCTTFRMHPDPILKYGIPSVTATSFGVCIVVANFVWGDGVWIVWFGHGLLVDNLS
jgi:hypothetical protein